MIVIMFTVKSESFLRHAQEKTRQPWILVMGFILYIFSQISFMHRKCDVRFRCFSISGISISVVLWYSTVSQIINLLFSDLCHRGSCVVGIGSTRHRFRRQHSTELHQSCTQSRLVKLLRSCFNRICLHRLLHQVCKRDNQPIDRPANRQNCL